MDSRLSGVVVVGRGVVDSWPASLGAIFAGGYCERGKLFTSVYIQLGRHTRRLASLGGRASKLEERATVARLAMTYFT